MALNDFGKNYPSLEKIELLPFRKICMTKYENMKLEFPLKDVPPCSAKTIEILEKYIDERHKSVL